MNKYPGQVNSSISRIFNWVQITRHQISKWQTSATSSQLSDSLWWVSKLLSPSSATSWLMENVSNFLRECELRTAERDIEEENCEIKRWNERLIGTLKQAESILDVLPKVSDLKNAPLHIVVKNILFLEMRKIHCRHFSHYRQELENRRAVELEHWLNKSSILLSTRR